MLHVIYYINVYIKFCPCLFTHSDHHRLYYYRSIAWNVTLVPHCCIEVVRSITNFVVGWRWQQHDIHYLLNNICADFLFLSTKLFGIQLLSQTLHLNDVHKQRCTLDKTDTHDVDIFLPVLITEYQSFTTWQLIVIFQYTFISTFLFHIPQ